MPRLLALTSFLVPDYDEALSFFTTALRFTVLQDTPLAPDKRWVVVAPSTAPGGALLLARASAPEQRALIGRQGGGRVWLFLHCDDIDTEMAHLRAHGVAFDGDVRHEAYGRVVVFTDCWGNRWDLIQPANAS